jgi:hypothetical protein
MATTITNGNVQPISTPTPSITKAQFVKNYRASEKRARVCAGGLAFTEADRLMLNQQRQDLNYDCTMAAEAVSLTPSEHSRHWQRFDAWDKQVKKGVIRVAPEAAYQADRTHKSSRRNVGKKASTSPVQHQQLSLATVIASMKPSSPQGVTVVSFDTREDAEAHLKAVCLGLVKLGMVDADGISTIIQSGINEALGILSMQTKAQMLVEALGGMSSAEAVAIMELARNLMPA